MIITHTILEPTSKHDPFYLQNLMYDLSWDITTTDDITIRVTIPKGMNVYMVDDLHFVNTKNNHLEFILEESSSLIYKLYVANHKLCESCSKKEDFCQTLPEAFQKYITVNLTQPNAQAYINCHYLGDTKSNLKITTVQNHKASNTTSKLNIRGVLDDQAKLFSDNTIIVDKNIHTITAEQMNKNLMLNQNAHVVSIPKLQINSNDVICKHGAIIKMLDPGELFYLQSRGIEKTEAERLLVEAFLRHD